jgi:hypothetical protein
MLLVGSVMAATGPDLYERVGSVTFEKVVSFASRGGDIYLLLEHSVVLAHASEPGRQLSAVTSSVLEQSYQRAYLQGNWLYLYSSEGEFAVVRALPDTLLVVDEETMSDSILGMAAKGRYLYLATGASGIAIVDAANKREPVTIGRANYGAYYTNLKIYDSLLFGIDALSGIDVYLIKDSALIYRSTVYTDRSVVDLMYAEGYLYTCYGNDALDKWSVVQTDLPEFVSRQQFDDAVLFLGNSGSNALLGFNQGRVARYDMRQERRGESYQLGYPVEKVAVDTVAAQSAFAVLDAVGRLSVLSPSGDGLTLAKEYVSEIAPSAIAATDRGVVIAKPGRGLYLVKFESGIPKQKLLHESSLAFNSLVIRDSLLFAAVAGRKEVVIFKFSAERATPLATAETDLIPERLLFLFPPGREAYRLLAVGVDGVEAITFSPETRTVSRLWRIKSPFVVTRGYCDERSLALASESGAIDLYCLDGNWPQPDFQGRFYGAPSPRAICVVDGQYLLSGGKAGISVDKFDHETLSFKHISSIAAVTLVTDLCYDPSQKQLIVAGGDQDVKYLDFSQPEDLGVVYHISNSRGATAISCSNDFIYAVGGTALSAFQGPSARQLPISLQVSDCYPNPFNGVTTIEVSSSRTGATPEQLKYQVINILGQVIRQEQVAMTGRSVRIIWDGADDAGRTVSSGLYFFWLRSANGSFTRKMLLVK